MYFHVFKIKCITNLHAGSGDINYNVVDKEVEKELRANKREFIPLQRIKKSYDRDQEKLRRKDG